jgi:photosystem II stability/assembly factor-like uncharacterized protein
MATFVGASGSHRTPRIAVLSVVAALSILLLGCEERIDEVDIPLIPKDYSWKLQRPLPFGTVTFSDIYGTSASNIFAVGDEATIAHFDGTSWKSMSAGDYNGTILKVWAASDHDAFAVAQSGVILRYDGAKWSVSCLASDDLTAIWGSGASDVWALSYDRAYHYDGAKWTGTMLPTEYYASDIWGSSDHDIYAVGDWRNDLLHYDGSTWAPIEGPATYYTQYSSIWGSGPRDVWIAGASDTVGHFDGTSWRTVKCPTPYSDRVIAVSGTGANDIYFQCGSGVIHYDGETFVHLDGWPLAQYIKNIWAAPGALFCACSEGMIVAYEGSDCKAVVGGQYLNLNDVWTDAPDNAWAVGDMGTILHFNGGRWTDESDPSITDLGLEAIGGTRANLYAVGFRGIILHYDGTAWRDISHGGIVRESLTDIWAMGNEAFAVGAAGSIVHITGTTPRLMASGTTKPLYGIWGTAPNDLFVAGSKGALLHYDGARWSPMQSPDTTSYFSDVWGTSRDNVLVCGNMSFYLLRFDGSEWTCARLDHMYRFNRLWGATANDLYGVERDVGGILHFDGAAWAPQGAARVPGGINSIKGSGPDNVFAVGEQGVILHRGP